MKRQSNKARCRKLAQASLTTAIVACCWISRPAMAQSQALIREEKTPVKQWVALVVFSGAIIAIAFKNAKRTHNG